VTVVLRRRGDSAAEAERLRAAVGADNPDYVRVEVVGTDLVVRVEARSAASARTTIDDLLACLRAAERAVPTSPASDATDSD
jgi:hypothetical protein